MNQRSWPGQLSLHPDIVWCNARTLKGNTAAFCVPSPICFGLLLRHWFNLSRISSRKSTSGALTMNRFARSFRMRDSFRSSSSLRRKLWSDVKFVAVAVAATPEHIAFFVASSSSAANEVRKLSMSESVKRGEFVASSAIGFYLTATLRAMVNFPAQCGHVLAFEDDATGAP